VTDHFVASRREENLVTSVDLEVVAEIGRGYEVVAGLRVVDPALAAETLATGESLLTARERDVLSAARGGGTVADIAKALFLSDGTVRNYLSSAIGKTGARGPARRPHVWRAAGLALGPGPRATGPRPHYRRCRTGPLNIGVWPTLRLGWRPIP
jgi:DNA-binding CsgD family transcriptional regulator